MGMGKYNIILWDLDQTLLNFEKAEEYAIRQSFEAYGKRIDKDTVALYSAINDSYWKRLEKGEVTQQEVLYGRFRTLFEQLSIGDIRAEQFADVYRDKLSDVYFYMEDSYSLCQELKKNYRQYIVTNGVAKTQRKRIELAGFDKLMDGVFISEEIGYPKPEKAFFDRCFAAIPDFTKERTIIVGDSLSSDMAGGKRAGIACCWYHPEKREQNTGQEVDYEISSLRDVIKILNGK
jgi:2-haloacid dehalogenase